MTQVMGKDGKNENIRISPDGANVGNRVHEYGGRSSIVVDKTLFYSEDADQILYAYNIETREKRALSKPGYRYADFSFDRNKNAILAVREDHTTTPPTNTIVAVDVNNGTDHVLVHGSDFYSSPRISPRGDKLAYISWDHPNMPWDSTQLWIFDRESGSSTLVAGKSESIMEPQWSPDNILYFVTDRRNGWWNIHRFKRDKLECVYEVDAEIGGPAWQFGKSSFCFLDENKIICDVTFRDKNVLTLFDIPRQIATAYGTNCTSHEFVCISSDHYGRQFVYFLASSHVRTKCVMRLEIERDHQQKVSDDNTNPAYAHRKYEIHPKMDPVVSTGEVKVPLNYLSVPDSVEFLASNRVFSYGYFYGPKNPDFISTDNELPPVLVLVHGGPTGATTSDLNLLIQYWTTRGFAVFDVNYGGSTGYGRPYRERLYEQWGVVDVDDVCSGLQYLIDMGRVDPDRTCISGGSAGGFTTLSCLTFRNLFKAGASYYGVSDPARLAQDTHKFEARYLDKLIGPYPQAKKLYEDRSPLHNVRKLNCPVIFFQGLEDKVVTPNQTELMFNAVKDKGLPVSMIMFKDEYHGFHNPATIKQCLEAEFYFYCQIFGIDAKEPSVPLKIENEKNIQAVRQ
eukprot:Phypoly_transcript_04608.p1 GENE.Phypoly_transcript_04608~~Phypoly_transcript_04608.p1  ORF type:complete len:709 (+),score=98.66 Phypoly_transcript_04608:258-2129(+)